MASHSHRDVSATKLACARRLLTAHSLLPTCAVQSSVTTSKGSRQAWGCPSTLWARRATPTPIRSGPSPSLSEPDIGAQLAQFSQAVRAFYDSWPRDQRFEVTCRGENVGKVRLVAGVKTLEHVGSLTRVKRVTRLQPSSVPYLDISQTPSPPMASAEMNATRAHGRPRQRGLHSR